MLKMQSSTLLLLVAASLLTAAAPALAEDKVQTKDGNDLAGTIDKITSSGIIMVSGDKIPASEIDYVRFDREPPELSGARGMMKRGDYADALAQLNTLDEPTRLAIIEEVAFRKALCLVEMSKSRDKAAKGVAINEMNEFVNRHGNSFHYYEANKVIGDLFVAAGVTAKAIPYYDKLAQSPLPAYKMLGRLVKADLLYLNNDFAGAKTEYEAIMSTAATDGVSRTYALQGTLGYAACLAAMKDSAKALEITNDVIKKADPAAEQMHARAYNTLGKCYLNSGREDALKQALRAFLIVDIVYSAYPDEHAEALYYLQGIWNKMGDRTNANESRARLQGQYQGSTWVSRAAAAE